MFFHCNGKPLLLPANIRLGLFVKSTRNYFTKSFIKLSFAHYREQKMMKFEKKTIFRLKSEKGIVVV